MKEAHSPPHSTVRTAIVSAAALHLYVLRTRTRERDIAFRPYVLFMTQNGSFARQTSLQHNPVNSKTPVCTNDGAKANPVTKTTTPLNTTAML